MRYIIARLMASTLAMTAAGAALAAPPRVVSDIAPVQSLVAAVMGDLGQPELLVPQGTSEHDFQLKVSQAAALAEADLVVWVGPELTPWLETALKNRPETAPTLGLLARPNTHLRSYGAAAAEHVHEADLALEARPHQAPHADHHDHDHADGDHAEGHDHAGHDHDHAHVGTDPHAWLDPVNGLRWLGAISEELARLDPENAATYAGNASAAAEAIGAAEAEAAALLGPVQAVPFVTWHDAYGYYTGHFGLNQRASLADGGAQEGGAARLSELHGAVGAGEVTCLFPEFEHSQKPLEQLAESGARLGKPLDLLGSSLTPGPDLYPALLTGMARTLADCLGPQAAE